eukprot:TRINITY_DN6416_c0_g2_i1.p1 TRINITY_DN6416_c0_g2~~TRINITY_DN6416_c0_g2_i1.p1  ORF type:complete len:768 (-),score=129.61 TRINITY_DN6416_c0_g2_i1:582-2885(-)
MSHWAERTSDTHNTLASAKSEYCFACGERGHSADDCTNLTAPAHSHTADASQLSSPRSDDSSLSDNDVIVDDILSRTTPATAAQIAASTVTTPRSYPQSRRISLVVMKPGVLAPELSSFVDGTSSEDSTASPSVSPRKQDAPTSHWEVARAKLRALNAFKDNVAKPKKSAAAKVKEAQHSVTRGRPSIVDQTPRLIDDRKTSIFKTEKKNKISDDMIQVYVKDILSKNPEERTEDDKNFLRDCTKRLKFFVNMSPNVHADLCKVMQYVSVPAGEVVFYQGSIGKTFYVILSGSVTVHVKSADEEHQDDRKSHAGAGAKDMQGKRASISRLPLDKSSNASSPTVPTIPEATEAPYDFGRLVGTLASGDAFGELALLTNPTAPRAASIIAVEDTEFLTIHKTDYDRTLKRIQIQLLENKLMFLRSMSIFRNWDTKRLTRFSHFMKSNVFNAAETIIVKQAEVTESIFLIYKGACRIIFQAELENDRNANPPWAQLEDSSVFFKTLSMNYMPMPYSLMAPQKRKVRFELAVLGPGEMFGEGGVIAGAPQLGMIIAESDTELLVINKSDFVKRMDEQSKQSVKKVWEMKNGWLESRLKEIIRLKLQNRPTDIVTNMNQAGSLNKQAQKEDVHPSGLSKEILKFLGPPLRRPQPPDDSRMKSLAQPRNPRPPARNRRRLLELLERKLTVDVDGNPKLETRVQSAPPERNQQRSPPSLSGLGHSYRRDFSLSGPELPVYAKVDNTPKSREGLHSAGKRYEASLSLSPNHRFII